MRKHWRQLFFFTHCLIFFLVINLPLGLVMGQVQLPPQLKLYQPSGTLFHGGLGQVQADRVVIRDISFQWQFGCLMKLQWCYQLQSPEGGLVAGVNLLTWQVELSEVDIDYPMSAITPLIPNLLVEPTGNLRFQSDRLVLESQRPVAINAVVTWNGLGVNAGNESLTLGDYRVVVTGDADRINYEVEDINGLLQASGGGSIGRNGRYDVSLELSSQDVLPDRLKSILELVARPAGYNQYRIIQQGTDRRLSW